MKSTILTSALIMLIGLVLATFTHSISAENTHESSRAKVLQLTQQDPGVDLGVVIATRANLREFPDPTSRVIKQLVRGEVLALVSRVPAGAWYHVIHIQSSEDGWINGNTIRVKYTEKKKSGPVFEERETGTTTNPRIEITNDSDHTLYLKVGDEDRVIISPHVTKTIFEDPGTYKFYASSPGVIPAFGEHEFRIGVTYEWTFYIVTSIR